MLLNFLTIFKCFKLLCYVIFGIYINVCGSYQPNCKVKTDEPLSQLENQNVTFSHAASQVLLPVPNPSASLQGQRILQCGSSIILPHLPRSLCGSALAGAGWVVLQ